MLCLVWRNAARLASGVPGQPPAFEPTPVTAELLCTVFMLPDCWSAQFGRDAFTAALTRVEVCAHAHALHTCTIRSHKLLTRLSTIITRIIALRCAVRSSYGKLGGGTLNLMRCKKGDRSHSHFTSTLDVYIHITQLSGSDIEQVQSTPGNIAR